MGQTSPRSHIRVLDLTSVIAGPVVGRLLAHLGAQVIKVEPPWTMPTQRSAHVRLGETAGRPYNQNLRFNEVNRGKLSLPVNLSKPQGRELLLKLVAICDVVLENYSPRVMNNLGLQYPVLRQANPDLIMVSMPALGSTGPWANFISFGPGTDALSGMSDITGYWDGPPSKPGNFYADPNAAYHAAFAVLAALWHRRRTGRGQQIEVALREAEMAVIGEYFVEYQLTGRAPARVGNQHTSMAPHGIYRCLGEDAWVAITVESDQHWHGLCRAMGDPPWARDPRFRTALGRWRHQEALDRRVGQWTREFPPQEVMEILQARGVPAGAVLTAPEILTNPQFQSRGFIDRAEHSETGMGQHPGVPWRYSRSSLNVGRRAPLFGEHIDYVLGELLNLSHAEITQLEADQVVVREPL